MGEMTVETPGQGTLPPAVAERLGFLFAQLHLGLLRMAADSGAFEGPLTGKHFGCLTVLIDEGPLSQQELGGRMRVDRSTIVSIVDDLEAGGLVERGRNPNDRRAYALAATVAGRAWQRKTEKRIRELEDELLAPLSAGERRELVSLMQRVLLG